MAAASQNNLTLTLQQQDANGVNVINRTVGAISFSGAEGQTSIATLTTTGATALPFPVGLTNAYQIYIKNTSATGNVTINVTPTAATGSVIVAKLTPGSVCVPIWAASSGSSGAVTAVTGTADTTNCTLEYFIGG